MDLFIAQYGHIGYQNDGTEIIYRMMGFDLKIVTRIQLDRQTHTQTNCNENITPPHVRGGVIWLFGTIHFHLFWLDVVKILILSMMNIIYSKTISRSNPWTWMHVSTFFYDCKVMSTEWVDRGEKFTITTTKRKKRWENKCFVLKFVFLNHKAHKVGANFRFLWRLADRWLSPPPGQDVSLLLETSPVKLVPIYTWVEWGNGG